MNNEIRDITHHNVVRLLAAIESERDRRMDLQRRFDALQEHVTQMTRDLKIAQAKANAAFAMASNSGGSTSGN